MERKEGRNESQRGPVAGEGGEGWGGSEAILGDCRRDWSCISSSVPHIFPENLRRSHRISQELNKSCVLPKHPKKGSGVRGGRGGGGKSAKYLQNQAKPFVVASWGNNQDGHDSSILVVTGVGQERFMKAERRASGTTGTFGLKLEPWHDSPSYPYHTPLYFSSFCFSILSC